MTPTDSEWRLTDELRSAAILIVDDQPSNVALVREMLSIAGYHDVEGVTDPLLVPDLCRARRFDLLLIDVRMPRMSGFDLMDALKAVHGTEFVPVIVLTAQTDQETRRSALARGASDFLTKPFMAWELLHRVRNVLEVRTLYSRLSAQNRDLERHVAERTHQLEEALAAVRRADRAKVDFLSVMSHELRTPLNLIIGFAEMMISRSKGPLGHPDYEEYAAHIEESGQRLLGMVSNIFDYARGAMGALRLYEDSVDLPDLLAECTAALAPKAAAKGVALTFPPVPPLRLRADRRRLREMVLTLLDNAVKFNRPGGNATVTAELTPTVLTIHVADDGPGIPAGRRDRLFDPFQYGAQTLVREHDGIGLGLPMVRRLAELHGGTVEIAGEHGRGTIASIMLPAQRVERDAAET